MKRPIAWWRGALILVLVVAGHGAIIYWISTHVRIAAAAGIVLLALAALKLALVHGRRGARARGSASGQSL